MTDLVKVKTEGTWFLCTVVYAQGTPTALEYAMVIPVEELKSGLADWVKKNNIDELSTVVIGKNQGFIKKDLSKKEQSLLTGYVQQMKEIKKYALLKYENTLFQQQITT
jgi:pyridoxal/pyridoxine/pyridoxamine kinase